MLNRRESILGAVWVDTFRNSELTRFDRYGHHDLEMTKTQRVERVENNMSKEELK